MSLVSYAQNFEDVMLWRALKHVENGFYVDIGAQDPVIDSVSLAFYEHGWRGVHVEPTQQYSSKLRHARPDETIYQSAIGTGSEKLVFFEFADTGLSTADAAIAQNHKASGFECIETIVPILSLDSLFADISSRDIHWLKLDVEGLEKNVIESWKDSNVRPWVLVIESTRPLSQDECHKDWEPLVIAKGYTYVYSDGLNRFYVSDEHPELVGKFKYPPNIFDDFLLSGLASQPFCRGIESELQLVKKQFEHAQTGLLDAINQAETAMRQVEQLEKELKNKESRVNQAEVCVRATSIALHEKNNELAKVLESNHQHFLLAEASQQQIQAIYDSTSWRITSPIRYICDGVKKTWPRDFKNWLINFARHASLYVNRRPKIQNIVLVLINKSPNLRIRLRNIIGSPALQCGNGLHKAISGELSNLTPHEYQIYMALKVKVDSKMGGEE